VDAAAGVLRAAGAAVEPGEPGTLIVTGLAAETVVSALTAGGVPFAEISSHRATLEEAYLELTRDAVEFRATGGPVETR
jgi:ABC-2 type transport system ATP-binding protein